MIFYWILIVSKYETPCPKIGYSFQGFPTVQAAYFYITNINEDSILKFPFEEPINSMPLNLDMHGVSNHNAPSPLSSNPDTLLYFWYSCEDFMLGYYVRLDIKYYVTDLLNMTLRC